MGEEHTHLHVDSDESTLNSSTDTRQQTTQRGTSRGRRCVCVSASIFFVLLLAAAIIILVLLLLFVGHQPARINTSCGVVEGKFDPVSKVFIFKGIPFAEAPIKQKRWSAPVPLKNETCWKDVYHADKFMSACIQVSPFNNQVEGSEDCLYLNIYTPSVDPTTPLPVMFYIHGGYLQWGDGKTKGYCPDEKVTSQMNMVFVSIQYRLNAFGFLVSEALPGRGNYGFLDQIEALRWVNENIAGFGGDPKHITVFGQSSGGTSTWALMMSPLAKGLFQKAWIISGSPVYNKTTEEAISDNAWLLDEPVLKNACGKKNVSEECLLNLNPSVILDAIYPKWDVLADSQDLPFKGQFEPALPVIDGTIIPAPPFDMWENKNMSDQYSDVPVIIGTTAEEVDVFPTPGRDLLTWSRAQLEKDVAYHLDPFGNGITNKTLALYPDEKDAEFQFTSMTSDVRMTCGNNEMSSRAAAALSSNVYRYVIKSYPSKPVNAFGFDFPAKYAFHGWDSYAFFWGFDELMDHVSQSDFDFGHLIQAEIKNFVETGKPKSESWLAYPNVTALIDKDVTLAAHWHKEECEMWLENGFFSYSWIN